MNELKHHPSSDRSYYLFAFRIIGDFGATIAVPVVLFALAGRWLDERYHGGWLFTVLAFILAALLSGIIIYRKAEQYGQEYQKLGDRK
ncbi:MAG: AtpZ/AtpI family protein [Parcubacteria group bacterium]|nr:AtpZ/AtpI family protein [Parcubacteria group bacterium]